MAFDINTFRQSMIGDGARPNLFEVYLNNPQGGFFGDVSNFKFKIKSSELPGTSIGAVSVNYFGREVKFAGNRRFADWTITVINDEDFSVRKFIEGWMAYINSHETNTRFFDQTSTSYVSDMTVIQYGKIEPEATKIYLFKNAFPIDLAPISLDWGNNDTIEEFTVTFAYDYWTTNSPPVA